jgi:serine/threonine protein kinase
MVYKFEGYGPHLVTRGEDIPFKQDNVHSYIQYHPCLIDEITGTAGSAYNEMRCIRKLMKGTSERITEFQNEVDILKIAQHDHVVKLITTYIFKKNEREIDFAIIMDRADRDLDEYLRSNKSQEQFPQWIGCLISTLSFIHEKRIEHRDIKPKNILVKNKEGVQQVLLADFGISNMCAEKTVSVSEIHKSRPRTPGYAAPEVEAGAPSTQSADIYSLGVVLLEILYAHNRPEAYKKYKERMDLQEDSDNGRIGDVQSMIADIQERFVPTDWRNKALELCKKMIEIEKDQRSKANELVSWWTLQISAISTQLLACTCSQPLDDIKQYGTEKMNKKLRMAYENGHRLMVEYWKEKKAAIDPDEELVAALKGGLWDIVRSRLGNGVNITDEAILGLPSSSDCTRVTDEYRAFMYWWMVMKLLLKKKAQFMATDESGETPLLRAAKYGYEIMAKLRMFDENTGIAVMSKNIWRMLLGEDTLIKVVGGCGQTPLSRIAMYGHEAVLRLLDESARIEAMDESLLRKSWTRHEWEVKRLLDSRENCWQMQLWRAMEMLSMEWKLIASLVILLVFGVLVFLLRRVTQDVYFSRVF